MKFSESWIREWINPKIDTLTLCNQLTNIGFEANVYDQTLNKFNNKVVGKIIRYRNFSENDKLKLVTIDVGLKYLLSTFSKLSGYYIGMTVVVSILESNVKIFKSTSKKNLQNEKLKSKICSYLDLGFQNYENKIVELPSHIKPGTKAKDVFSTCFPTIQINTTPNRSYGISLLTLSRELSAINNYKFLKFFIKKKSLPPKKIQISIEKHFDDVIYAGKVIKNVNTNIDTPFWLIKKLLSSNTKIEKNVIQNIINYVYIEIGQPIHAINYNLVKKGIYIRTPRIQDIKSLYQNNDIKLNKNSIIISNDNQILLIGNNVNKKLYSTINYSKNLFIGSISLSPYFSFNNLKKETSILEKSSHVYEYGIDYSLLKKAIEYISNMITKICGGNEFSVQLSSYDSSLIKPKIVNIRPERFQKIIGNTIPIKTVYHTLKTLGYSVLNNEIKKVRIIIPTWRYDINIEEHIIEDFLRIYGYSTVSLNSIQNIIRNKKNNINSICINTIKNMLINRGYFEIVTYGFVNPNVQKIFFPESNPLFIKNPISQELSCMKQSHWIGLLNCIQYNQKRKIQSIRLFEIGLCFFRKTTKNFKAEQNLVLSGAITGLTYPSQQWDRHNKILDFYDLKGDVESIFELYGILNKVDFRNAIIDGLHPGRSGYIYLKKTIIGKIGEIHPEIQKLFKIKTRTIVFELFLKQIKTKNTKTINLISKFPTIERDLSFIIKKSIMSHKIIDLCKNLCSKNLVSLNIFDIYYGKQIPKEKKSISINFVFQSQKRTLTDKEIDLIIQNCVKKLKKKFNILLRNDNKQTYSL